MPDAQLQAAILASMQSAPTASSTQSRRSSSRNTLQREGITAQATGGAGRYSSRPQISSAGRRLSAPNSPQQQQRPQTCGRRRLSASDSPQQQRPQTSGAPARRPSRRGRTIAEGELGGGWNQRRCHGERVDTRGGESFQRCGLHTVVEAGDSPLRATTCRVVTDGMVLHVKASGALRPLLLPLRS